MPAPRLVAIDHIHVMVADRIAAERWYARVLGLHRVPALEAWTSDGGPLTLGNAADTVHLALFERPPGTSRSTIALSIPGTEFTAWQRHLGEVLARPVDAVDHQLSWSLYFADPDGNPYEITSYDYTAVAQDLARLPSG